MKGVATMILATWLTIKSVSILVNRNPKELQESIGDAIALGFPDGSAFCKCRIPYGDPDIFAYVVFIGDIHSCEAWSFCAKRDPAPMDGGLVDILSLCT